MGQQAQTEQKQNVEPIKLSSNLTNYTQIIIKSKIKLHLSELWDGATVQSACNLLGLQMKGHCLCSTSNKP